MLVPEPYEFWMKQDMEWLEVCDALLRLPGESAGADEEEKKAKSLGLKIYYSIFDIPKVENLSH